MEPSQYLEYAKQSVRDMRADMADSYMPDKHHAAGSEVAREAPSKTEHEGGLHMN